MALSHLADGLWLVLQRAHGHVALLGLALLLHPVFGLRRATRVSPRVWLSARLATGALVLMNAGGWLIYPAYREQVRRFLYLEARWLGLSFEVKEHLAFYALCLGIAGLAVAWGARGAGGESGGGLEPAFWVRAVRRLYLAAFALALVSALIGLGLSVLRPFPSVLGDS